MDSANPFILMEKAYMNFSKTQQLIADVYIHKSGIAVMLSIRELSEMTGVSPVTIIRFARRLGYSGYTEMKKEMQRYYQKKIYPKIIKTKRFNKNSDLHSKLPDVFENAVKNEIELVTHTFQNLDINSLTLAVEALSESKTIYLVAYGIVLPAAKIFQHRLTSMNFHVSIITFENFSLTPTILSGTDEKDVFVIFSFPHYISTVKVIAQCAKLRKNQVICITDHISAPCVPFADILLFCDAYSIDFNSSMTAVIALINVLSSMLLIGLRKVVDENSEIFSIFSEEGLNISFSDANYLDLLD